MGPGEGIISPCEMVMFVRACSDDSNQRWSIKMTEHGKVFQNKRTVLFPEKKKKKIANFLPVWVFVCSSEFSVRACGIGTVFCFLFNLV